MTPSEWRSITCRLIEVRERQEPRGTRYYRYGSKGITLEYVAATSIFFAPSTQGFFATILGILVQIWQHCASYSNRQEKYWSKKDTMNPCQLYNANTLFSEQNLCNNFDDKAVNRGCRTRYIFELPLLHVYTSENVHCFCLL